jgi:aminopeptidase N
MTAAATPSQQETPETFYLKDYTPFGFEVETVELTFRLAPSTTRVVSKIRFTPKPGAADPRFFLHGEKLKLISASIDGTEVTPDLSAEGLSCAVPQASFIWESEVEIDPAGNTALEGLYMSNGMYCTQCEAEGFRKITYYPDRPDVMSTFTVRIEGDEEVLLSNGNPTSSGAGFAEWHDPWPKPAYLFALVAGDLVNHPDSFTTQSGKAVELNIWVRPGDEDKCAFGMEALKKSMSWDEEVYGREYDLDIFNIVAVDDFNMGAMENKGLNIFNSSCVLASPETSTDANFERIEAIIAHEYFHNWTGNRIPCRAWFPLCLKAGRTGFGDSPFTSDMRSAPVKRISDVIDLRARQFPEDQGPLSHPVRPEAFQEINNFYTAPIYEKGAEVIGMLKRLVGDAAYRKAVNLYFERHDGQACTIEDWLKVFEDSTGRDLTQFQRWYAQAGTPRLQVAESFEDGTYTLSFEQSTAPTPGQPHKDPRVIPIAVGLLNDNGNEVQPTTVLEMTEAKQSFTFEGLASKPVPSILREFSAPVILERASSNAERAFLLAHDSDPFNRWEAGNALAKETRIAMVLDGQAPDAAYLDALQKLLRDDDLDPAFQALVLQPPGQSDIAQTLHERGHVPDPQKIYDASETFAQTLAQQLSDSLPRLYADTTVEGAYSPDAVSASKRGLNGRILSLLTRLDGGQQARRQFEAADNMTQQFTALAALLNAEKGAAQSQAFFDQWQGDRLVMDKWFALQGAVAAPEKTAEVAAGLTQHPLFTLKNPNRFRAVMGALAGSHAGFHHASGAGYSLLADNLIALDSLNPQTTARMCTAFQTWTRYDADRQALIRTQLHRIKSVDGLSRDTNEMVSRILEAS